MYSRQEAAKQREAFWTAFGKYMRPILSADDTKINWVNYKTGVSGIRFEMAVDDRQASVCVTLVHDNPAVLESYYNQLLLLKNVLEETLGEPWLWQPSIQDESGRKVSKVCTSISNVNVYKNEDWPQIISFFKPRIMALDEFWSMAKYSFDTLPQ